MINLFNKTKILNLNIFSSDEDNNKTKIACFDFNFDKFEYFSSFKSSQLVLVINNKEKILNGTSVEICTNRYLFKFNSYFESYNFHKTIIKNSTTAKKIQYLSSFSLSKLNYFYLHNKASLKKKQYFYIEPNNSKQSQRKNILIGSSKPITDIRKIIQSTYKRNQSVLISGVKGSGKKLLSKIIIEESEIKRFDFINISTQSVDFDKCYKMDSTLLIFENFQKLKKSDLFNIISLSKYKNIICLSESENAEYLFDTHITMPSIASIKGDIPLLLKFFLKFHLNQRCKKTFFIENDLLKYISSLEWQNVGQISYFSYLIVEHFNDKILNSTHCEQIYELYSKEFTPDLHDAFCA